MPSNFKPEKPWRSKTYLRHIASLPCVACGASPSECHHLLRTREKAMGRKSGDNWCISLCQNCHTGLHLDGNERRWLGERGIDGPELAGILFQRWRDK